MSTAGRLDVERLAAIVGEGHVLIDRDLTASFGRDWTGRFFGSPAAVLRPASAAELAAVVGVLVGDGVAFVPQGGNTGLVGGGVPLGGEVVVSTTRLTGAVEVDVQKGELVADAGTTLAAAQRAAAEVGFELPIDLAARDSATLGGMFATDAAGLRALRFGRIGARVLSVEAVLANGAVIGHTGTSVKDGTGYPFARLLAGSEGTLGIVSRLRIRLVRPRRDRFTALVASPDLTRAVALARRLLADVADLESLEFVAPEGISLLARQRGGRPPVGADGDVLVLAEAASDDDAGTRLAAALSAAEAVGEAGEPAVASDPARRAALWHWREAQPEAIARVGIAHKLDVGLPLEAFAAAADAITAALRHHEPDATPYFFGHLGEGNLHVNILGARADDAVLDEIVLTIAAGLGGSIAAEHGVGRAKAAFVGLTRSPAELDAMRALKRALDPGWLANPGALFTVPR